MQKSQKHSVKEKKPELKYMYFVVYLCEIQIYK